LFNFLVLALYFAVTLWIVGSNKASLDTKALVECSHETSSKLQAAIGEDLLRNPMKAEYIRVVDVSGNFGCEVRLAGHEVALIQVVVDVNTDGVEAIQSRELGDKVDINVFLGRSECLFEAGVWCSNVVQVCNVGTFCIQGCISSLMHPS
jgi:hypothetical protein